MKSKLIVKEAMLLLERNMQVCWHFTNIEKLINIIEDNELKFSKSSMSRYEDKTSKGYKFFLSTSRTKNPDVNKHTLYDSKFSSGCYVRFEIDLQGFRTIPVVYSGYNDDEIKRGTGVSEYEERIVSNHIGSLSANDSRIVRIDVYIDKRKRTHGKIEWLNDCLKKIKESQVSKKVYIYNNKTDFIRQTNNTI